VRPDDYPQRMTEATCRKAPQEALVRWFRWATSCGNGTHQTAIRIGLISQGVADPTAVLEGRVPPAPTAKAPAAPALPVGEAREAKLVRYRAWQDAQPWQTCPHGVGRITTCTACYDALPEAPAPKPAPTAPPAAKAVAPQVTCFDPAAEAAGRAADRARGREKGTAAWWKGIGRSEIHGAEVSADYRAGWLEGWDERQAVEIKNRAPIPAAPAPTATVDAAAELASEAAFQAACELATVEMLSDPQPEADEADPDPAPPAEAIPETVEGALVRMLAGVTCGATTEKRIAAALYRCYETARRAEERSVRANDACIEMQDRVPSREDQGTRKVRLRLAPKETIDSELACVTLDDVALAVAYTQVLVEGRADSPAPAPQPTIDFDALTKRITEDVLRAVRGEIVTQTKLDAIEVAIRRDMADLAAQPSAQPSADLADIVKRLERQERLGAARLVLERKHSHPQPAGPARLAPPEPAPQTEEGLPW
jgi:hypothetical protein